MLDGGADADVVVDVADEHKADGLVLVIERDDGVEAFEHGLVRHGDGLDGAIGKQVALHVDAVGGFEAHAACQQALPAVLGADEDEHARHVELLAQNQLELGYERVDRMLLVDCLGDIENHIQPFLIEPYVLIVGPRHSQ